MMQGLKKWTKISKAIKTELGIDGKTGKQCRERWHNHLNPEVTKETWTEEEERKIFDLQKQMGNKWSEIASLMPGRTDNAIKNCFYSAIRRNLRKYNKGKTESEKLKGTLKQMLKKPNTRAILMKNYESTDFENSEAVKPIKILKHIKNEEDRPNDIIIPSISPLGNLTFFSFPMTPSTTPSILSSKYTPNFFNFSDRVEGLEKNEGFIKKDYDNLTDLSKSESTTPNYFLPHFSPRTTFQHYSSPRDSF